MIKFSESMAIALHSMIYLVNREDKVVSLKEIAKKFNVSENHLSKVLQRLVKEELVKSIKGPNGGFCVCGDYRNITYLDIYEIFEGKFKKHNCLFISNPKNCEKCIMSNLVDEINDKFINFMESHKIIDTIL